MSPRHSSLAKLRDLGLCDSMGYLYIATGDPGSVVGLIGHNMAYNKDQGFLKILMGLGRMYFPIKHIFETYHAGQ